MEAQVTRWQEKHGGRKYKRRTKSGKFRDAIASFVADLVRAHGNGKGWAYRSLHAKTFSRQHVSYRDFVSIVSALQGLALLEQVIGFQSKVDFGSGPLAYRRKASRFRSTPKLIKLTKHHGVDPAYSVDHFTEELPLHPIRLHAASTRSKYGSKIRGHNLTFERTPKIDALENDVKELNAYLRGFEIGNALHQYYIRIFNEGDNSRFDWNLGGRLYSPGKTSYQQMSRDQRKTITINGEAVCEIDVSASYLTIFLGWHGKQIDWRDGDPYAKGGLKQENRDAVKQWFVATFGSGEFIEKWSREAVANFREMTGNDLRKYSPSSIQQAALSAYPLLKHWPNDDRTWADLMWVESDAIIRTMLELKRERNVPSLPVHDSLLVPITQRRVSEWKLTVCYEKAAGVQPIIRTRVPFEGTPEPWELTGGID